MPWHARHVHVCLTCLHAPACACRTRAADVVPALQVDPTAGKLMLPYLAFVGYANALNWRFWKDNPQVVPRLGRLGVAPAACMQPHARMRSRRRHAAPLLHARCSVQRVHACRLHVRRCRLVVWVLCCLQEASEHDIPPPKPKAA